MEVAVVEVVMVAAAVAAVVEKVVTSKMVEDEVAGTNFITFAIFLTYKMQSVQS